MAVEVVSMVGGDDGGSGVSGQAVCWRMDFRLFNKNLKMQVIQQKKKQETNRKPSEIVSLHTRTKQNV